MRPLPSWAERFLRMICPEDLVDQITGDLIEMYQQDVKSLGARKAKWQLTLTVLRFLRPGILLRNRLSIDFIQRPLLDNYLKSSSRHFLKSKVSFGFKVLGLGLASLSFLVIVLYVSYQLSFDRFHEDYENIYRVNSQWRENGEMARYALVPSGVGPMLQSGFPEVRSYARMTGLGRYLVHFEGKSFHAEGIAETDSTIFDVLSFEFIRGDERALQMPKSIVLTESLANRMFDGLDPLEKSISFIDRGGISLQVTGVIKDPPPNSHLNIRALTSMGALNDSSFLPAGPWDISIDGSTVLYIRLHPGTQTQNFLEKATPAVRARITKNESGLEKEYGILLQPIKDIYLDPPIYAEFSPKGNVVYVYVFSLLALFLLVISSINYVNLSVADFHNRAKEIGVRKVMGARRKQIAFQVVLEAVLVLMLSLMISVGALYFLLPKIQGMLDPNLQLRMLMRPDILLVLCALIALLIILSTAYPAYQLAANNPVQNMKSIGRTGSHSRVSRVLLLTQLGISIVCITATLIVGKQLKFVQNRNPGYDRENLIVAHMPDQYPAEKIPVIKNEFAKVPGVEGVSFSTFRIAGAGYFRDWYRVEIAGEMRQMMLNEVFFDHDFFTTTGIPLVAGRSFDPARSTDSHEAFIVNETAVRAFGWKDPIGKRISYGYDETEGEKWEGTVVGVVKDFNVYSLHKKIEPLVMRLPWSDWPGSCVHIKIRGPLDETIGRIQKKYSEILPGFILHYSVVDDLYNSQYNNERKVYATLRLATWIIVVISCLGIFSLSLYLSLSRMKEFGIRKVLGATSAQITLLHTNKFLKLAAIANGFAMPVAWIVCTRWLEQFAYRTEMRGPLFALVAVLSVILVGASAGYSAWKSGTMNPVDAIKSE
ncbi:MAG TPA: ABC transporter permease [Chryseosolibacter sp.]|nr:ABC transporter permease [Chryseosolibacter sp.]